MAKCDLTKLKECNSKKGNNSIFDLNHHGDEVIIGTLDDGTVKMAVKIQTGLQEFRSTLLTFETQTQVERLFPAIMRAFRDDHRKR